MDRLKNIFQNSTIKYSLILIAGMILGWVIFGRGGHKPSTDHDVDSEASDDEGGTTVWTCSMHPQIKMDKPGKCPLCAMDLIPLQTMIGGDATLDDDAIQMSNEAIALANIQTSVVGNQSATNTIHLYGTIQVDERLQESLTSHVNGRIEKLYVNFTGETVKQGQLIATIYSPELLTAQQELLEAAKLQDHQPLLVEAAKEKLKLWKMSTAQIDKVLSSKEVSPTVNIHASAGGVVMSKNVSQGDYINPGTILYTLSNLSKLWAVFDAYEKDLPFLKIGDPLEYTLQSVPGTVFKGKISFINPIIDPLSRTAKIRVEANNQNGQLKPEMYTVAQVTGPLKEFSKDLAIPKSAILWTGKRSIVYVKQPNTSTPAFKLREVVLGPLMGENYIIMSGLSEGEEIVTHGTFTVDASAQLEGKKSMMNNSSLENNHANSPNKQHEMMKVSGNCSMCKDRIEKAAKGVKGVRAANWDVKTKTLHLDIDPKTTSRSEISKSIASVGHDTELDKAPKETYDALPSCCLYDRK